MGFLSENLYTRCGVLRKKHVLFSDYDNKNNNYMLRTVDVT